MVGRSMESGLKTGSGMGSGSNMGNASVAGSADKDANNTVELICTAYGWAYE